MSRVLCAGHVNWDVTLRLDRLPDPDGESRIDDVRGAGGGSAANVAVALSGLDLDARLLGSVGDDEHGHLARRELEEPGIDLAGLRTVEDADTTVKYLLVADDGEVAVLANDGANEAIGPADLEPALLDGVDHCHLTSQRPETAARLAGMANEREIPVSFDPGRRLAQRDFADTVELADLLFVNEQEAASVLEASGDPDADAGSDPAEPPVVGDQRVVVKHGAGGATLHGPGGSWSHPGFEIEPVDTTGAGDAFAAGFLAVTLDGGDTERALEYANACGALAATAEGARTAPVRRDVAAFLDGQF